MGNNFLSANIAGVPSMQPNDEAYGFHVNRIAAVLNGTNPIPLIMGPITTSGITSTGPVSINPGPLTVVDPSWPGGDSPPTYKGTLRILEGGTSLSTSGGVEFESSVFGSGYGWRILNYGGLAGDTPLVIQQRSNNAAWTEIFRFDALTSSVISQEPLRIVNSTSVGNLQLTSGNNSGSNTLSQIAFGWQGGSPNVQYQNWITTNHNGGGAAGNRILFWTGDGTANGVFATNAIIGLTIENGDVTPAKHLFLTGDYSAVADNLGLGSTTASTKGGYIGFKDAGALKWEIGKESDNSLRIWDSARGAYVLQFNPNSTIDFPTTANLRSASNDNFFGAGALGGTGTYIDIGSLGDGGAIWLDARGSPTDVDIHIRPKGAGNTTFTTGFVEATLGSLRSHGSGAGVEFQDRTGSNQWQWYASSNIARLWNGSADRLTLTSAGVLTSTSNMVVGGSYLSLNNAGSAAAPFVFGDATNMIFELAGAGVYQFRDSGNTSQLQITPLAATKIVPGATSLAFRNNGDSANNLLLPDNGQAVIRNGLALLGGTVDVGAGTMGYAQVTANQGTFTGLTDLTSLTVTATLVAGRRYKVTAFANFQSSVAGDRVAFILNDVTAGAQVQRADVYIGIATALTAVSMTFVAVPGAGSRTYKLQGQRASGTGNITLLAGATQPCLILLEDIGT